MTSISTRRRLLAALLLPFVMVLAGCGKLHADFDIQDVDRIDATFDVAIDEEFAAGSWSSADEFCQDAEGETLVDDADAPTVEPYEEDGRFGCVITGVITSDDYDSEFSLTEEDGEYHLVMSGDPSIDTSEIEGYGLEIDFRMTFTFPGEILEAPGGQIDGSSVTYTEMDVLAQGIDIRAEAGGSFPWVIVLVVVLVLGFLLLLVLAAAIFLVVRSRRKKNAAGTAAPAAYGAAAAMPGTAQPAPGGSQGSPQGQPWGQASPPPAAPPQGEQPWSRPPQDGQQWGQQPDPGQQPPQPPQR
ncbi:LppM family (lipo)protein [Brachybacterium saurashtrense]|uniref:LppM domain-containing protein n=1 Tax=Brachybacterium saurashtrense TaxID=556288 RepID=A0A345YQC1_9MICO|nr:hypothetical protein [Brachybacterium saurashtrense]AXK46123.1 hypothetical protein DWV08_11235 [Brachybacterium saurashtrense]RRR23863.1 hypothetical protein DXU92_02985 [Brachybacterium saurashtrense]